MGNELNDHFNEINQLLVQNKDILSSKLYAAITSLLYCLNADYIVMPKQTILSNTKKDIVEYKTLGANSIKSNYQLRLTFSVSVATTYSDGCQSSEFSQETVNNLYDYLVQVLEDDSLLKSATNTDKVIDYRGDKL